MESNGVVQASNIIDRAATLTADASEHRLGRTTLTLGTACTSEGSRLNASLKAAHKKRATDKAARTAVAASGTVLNAITRPYNIIVKVAIYPSNKERGFIEVRT